MVLPYSSGFDFLTQWIHLHISNFYNREQDVYLNKIKLPIQSGEYRKVSNKFFIISYDSSFAWGTMQRKMMSLYQCTQHINALRAKENVIMEYSSQPILGHLVKINKFSSIQTEPIQFARKTNISISSRRIVAATFILVIEIAALFWICLCLVYSYFAFSSGRCLTYFDSDQLFRLQ